MIMNHHNHHFPSSIIVHFNTLHCVNPWRGGVGSSWPCCHCCELLSSSLGFLQGRGRGRTWRDGHWMWKALRPLHPSRCWQVGGKNENEPLKQNKLFPRSFSSFGGSVCCCRFWPRFADPFGPGRFASKSRDGWARSASGYRCSQWVAFWVLGILRFEGIPQHQHCYRDPRAKRFDVGLPFLCHFLRQSGRHGPFELPLVGTVALPSDLLAGSDLVPLL